MKSILRRLRNPNVWIPSTFFAMFAVIISVNAVMVYISQVTWRGLETPSAHEAGQVYNAVLEREARVAELGWTLDADVTDNGGRTASVEVRFADGSGEALAADLVRVAFVRPTQEGHDVTADLKAAGLGVYKGEVALPLPGLWDLRVAALRGDKQARASKRVMIER